MIKPYISFLGGLILTGLIYAAITFILVFGTFSFSGETLTEKENREALFFCIAFFTTTVTIFAIVRRFKTNRKFSAIGMCIPLVVALYACFMLGRVYFENVNYHEAFDKKNGSSPIPGLSKWLKLW